MSIREITIINVHPGQENDFGQAYRDQGRDLLLTTPGCESSELFQSEEDPARFVNINLWESKEAHLRNFRDTDRFAQWAALLRPMVAGLPDVKHYENVTA